MPKDLILCATFSSVGPLFWCLNSQLNNGAGAALKISSTTFRGLLVQPQIVPGPLWCHFTKHNETSTRNHSRSSARSSAALILQFVSRALHSCLVSGQDWCLLIGARFNEVQELQWYRQCRQSASRVLRL
ncbi:uncharacterized protein BDZ83DRAFT_655608 [Colletotrichum acutatum]|uniref:Uncharacterized protein n=1 Tax=Glomerella acutata TaxID=27357 RepID=A0AAD8XDA8_GLOAC|nr:uncharacterized protein BDZ83DRAFT_655608 [Colletotrichum acutatum]KAK1716124.1 hypothetical protein BDZ83DRAFT_655608 [Colletotrichum acutatum]